jgi:hypothetical protein
MNFKEVGVYGFCKYGNVPVVSATVLRCIHIPAKSDSAPQGQPLLP